MKFYHKKVNNCRMLIKVWKATTMCMYVGGAQEYIYGK